jgi:SAM domain (Sterile alpha motif)
VSTIGDWLASLGMSEHVERFTENRIDLSVLPELTDQDLEKLGVLMGDRRKTLRAIREERVGCRYARSDARARAACSGDESRACRRTPLHHRHVLRSGQLNEHLGAARCRGMARPCW